MEGYAKVCETKDNFTYTKYKDLELSPNSG